MGNWRGHICPDHEVVRLPTCAWRQHQTSWAGIGWLHHPASCRAAVDLDQRRPCCSGHAMTARTASAVLTAFLAATSPVLAVSAPSPAAIRDSIKREGAKATIADLAKADQWDAVSDRMDSGSADWIALAPLLASGSDAGSAEDLGISLAFSLPKNPNAVLAALDPANGPVIGADRVCGCRSSRTPCPIFRPTGRRRCARCNGSRTRSSPRPGVPASPHSRQPGDRITICAAGCPPLVITGWSASMMAVILTRTAP